MKRDILGKIGSVVDRRIKREETVVYVLNELYKLLESQDQLKKYPVTIFVRNWAAHHEIGYDSSQWVFIQYVEGDDKVKNLFFSFEVLRQELGAILTNNALSSFLVGEGWFQFRTLLIAVVQDTIVMRNAKSAAKQEGVYVKEFRISKPGKEELFSRDLLTYHLTLSDGSEEESSVFLGDKDSAAKLHSMLSDAQFRYHYNRKAFMRLGDAVRRSTDEIERAKLEAEYESVYKLVKQNQSEIQSLSHEIAENEFSDEFYR